MTHLLSRATLSLALLFAPPAAFAQTAPAAPPQAAPAKTRDAHPALWVVKDKDTTIYLFGTIHVLSPDLNWFKGPVKQAFDASGEMVTEIGTMPEPAAVQPIIIKYALMPDGPRLTQRIPADKRDAFAKAVADSGVPAAAFESFRPWFAASQLSLIALGKAGYNPASGAEATLDAAAKAAGKPVSGLETLEMQFGYFNSLSDAAQIQFLTESVDQLSQIDSQFVPMIDAWAKGDAERLGGLMNDALRSSPELSKMLLADRNARWADWIKARLDKPGTVFMAVGAGHLAGPDSVQAMLKARKIKSKRVKS